MGRCNRSGASRDSPAEPRARIVGLQGRSLDLSDEPLETVSEACKPCVSPQGRERPLVAGRGDTLDRQYDDAEQLWLDLEPDGEDALIKRQDPSIGARITVGTIAGHTTLRLHTSGAALEEASQPKPLTAARDGFSLNAAGA